MMGGFAEPETTSYGNFDLFFSVKIGIRVGPVRNGF